jgi:hypothetical protein
MIRPLLYVWGRTGSLVMAGMGFRKTFAITVGRNRKR